MSEYLFQKNGELIDYFSREKNSLKQKVDELGKDIFAGNPDEVIVNKIFSDMRLEPLELYPDRETISNPETVRVDVSHDRSRYFHDSERPYYIDGVSVSLHIPYSGTLGLLHFRPSRSYLGNAPKGTVQRNNQNLRVGEIVVSISLPADLKQEDIAARMNTYFAQQRKMIAEYVAWSGQDVNKYNTELQGIILSTVQQRRNYLGQVNTLASLINIPLKEDPKAPKITPIELKPHIVVELSPPPKPNAMPEYGINVEQYEKILDVIRHESRTFEAAPETFNKFEEEELRDILLAHLNGHLKGAATAEAFRKKGKTDIRIEERDRSAFVAECKIWKGQAQVNDALDQLLNYLIWRDCKASLIVFNKEVSGFTELLKKLPEVLEKNPLLVEKVPTHQKGEWRFIFKSKEDAGRKITVHVFLVNIFFKK